MGSHARAHVSKAAAAALWLLMLEPTNHKPFLQAGGPAILLALCDDAATDEYLQAAFGIFRILAAGASDGGASGGTSTSTSTSNTGIIDPSIPTAGGLRTTLTKLGAIDRALHLIGHTGSADVLEQAVNGGRLITAVASGTYALTIQER